MKSSAHSDSPGYAANKDRKNSGTAWNWGTENLHDFPPGKNPFLKIKKFKKKHGGRVRQSCQDYPFSQTKNPQKGKF
ncbi:MAG: hypothetical protein PVJ77_16275 [Desulfobacterales bacterium]|jgi:hypothetical protein